ncbi:MAG: CopG family antitoxin [Candidatus Promineifilaceae bacterium]
MNNQKIPQTDSIEELAHFWDTHDLTDFEDQLKEWCNPVFEREARVTVRLQPEEAEAVQKIAAARGVADADLIHEWVREKIRAS